MYLGEETNVFGNWFILHFTENNGMAFGMEFAGNYGKLILSLFRVIAIVVIGWYIWKLVKTKVAKGLLVSLSLIFAGASGNIIDSAFYAMIFNQSPMVHEYAYFNPEKAEVEVINGYEAEIFPSDGGYGSFLHGKVVDMLYFPIIEGRWPRWMPFWGGEEFLFFRPVFNIADSSITIGVLMILLFQRRYFPKKPKEKPTE